MTFNYDKIILIINYDFKLINYVCLNWVRYYKNKKYYQTYKFKLTKLPKCGLVSLKNFISTKLTNHFLQYDLFNSFDFPTNPFSLQVLFSLTNHRSNIGLFSNNRSFWGHQWLPFNHCYALPFCIYVTNVSKYLNVRQVSIH